MSRPKMQTQTRGLFSSTSTLSSCHQNQPAGSHQDGKRNSNHFFDFPRNCSHNYWGENDSLRTGVALHWSGHWKQKFQVKALLLPSSVRWFHLHIFPELMRGIRLEDYKFNGMPFQLQRSKRLGKWWHSGLMEEHTCSSLRSSGHEKLCRGVRIYCF